MSKNINLIMNEFIKNNNNLKNSIENFDVSSFFIDLANALLYEFIVITGGYEVRLKDNNLRDAIIPSTYNDIPIVSIGTQAFLNSSITNVTIPDSVTSIGEGAFGYCSQLSTVNISDASNLLSIGKDAFINSSITSITIPNKVNSISENVFALCSQLSTVYFKGPKPFIGINAFSAIKNNANGYYYPENAESWSDTNTIDGLTINVINTPSDSAIALLYNFTVITGGYEVRLKDTNLRDAIIPSTYNTRPIVSIGARAFYNSSITSITIPDSVTSIGKNTFAFCSQLSNVNINTTANLLSIGDNAFDNSSITSITIPNTVTSIGEAAFNNCRKLYNVNINTASNLLSIGNSAFNSSSITSITIPDKVTSISSAAFNGCKQLSTVYFNGPKPSTAIYAFGDIKKLAKGYYYPEHANSWSNTNTIDGLTIINIIAAVTQLSDTKVNVGTQILKSVDTNIDKAIEKVMKSLYPNIAYTTTQEGNTLYVDINNSSTAEYFADEVLTVIFRFKTSDKQLIDNLLNLDLSSLESKSKNNNLLLILSLSISIPLILIAIIIIYIVARKKYH